MPEASRISDTTLHGGAINQGAKLVIIGGMMAARKGDSYICPLHGTGVIIEGAAQVFIEGANAARKLDKCACAVVGVSGTGVPPTVGAPPVQWNASAEAKERGKMDADMDYKVPARGPHIEGELLDADKDGTLDTARGELSAVRMRNQAYGNAGWFEFGAKHNMDLFYGRGQVSSTVDGQGWIPGIGASGNAEAGMLKHGGEILVGPANDQGRNPYLAVGAEYDIFHAEAKGDALLGDDGRRVGVVGVVKAGGEALGGNVNARATTPTIFGGNIQLRGKVGATGASVQIPVQGGGWLYYDKQEKRLHLGAIFEATLELIAGAEVELDLSIGMAYQPPEEPAAPAVPSTPGIGPAGIPNALAQGHPMVLIGG